LVEFFVPGHPRPRGSKRPFVNRHTGKVAMVDMGKGSGEWMGVVKRFAADAYADAPLSGPVELTLKFVLPRPKAHYRTGRRAAELRPDAPTWHASVPDADKLGRGVQDALRGVLYGDDRQVASKSCFKVYGDRPGVLVRVAPIFEEAS
jgi:Holliday junction resolvase RusA-like endonuclease